MYECGETRCYDWCSRRAHLLCRSGETGRRAGLKIPWALPPVSVRFRPPAPSSRNELRPRHDFGVKLHHSPACATGVRRNRHLLVLTCPVRISIVTIQDETGRVLHKFSRREKPATSLRIHPNDRSTAEGPHVDGASARVSGLRRCFRKDGQEETARIADLERTDLPLRVVRVRLERDVGVPGPLGDLVDPTNPAGYLRHLATMKVIDAIAQSYVVEALECYAAGLYKAAAVMIGTAAEASIIAIRDLAIAKFRSVEKNPPSSLTGTNIKTITEALTHLFNRIGKNKHRELRERFDAHWGGLTHEIRTTRNDAGPPDQHRPGHTGVRPRIDADVPGVGGASGRLAAMGDERRSSVERCQRRVFGLGFLTSDGINRRPR